MQLLALICIVDLTDYIELQVLIENQNASVFEAKIIPVKLDMTSE